MTRQLLGQGVKFGGRSCETSEIIKDDGRARGPYRIWTDRNAQGVDREEDRAVPLSIRLRGTRSVNRIGKSFSNGDTARLLDSDWNAEVVRFALG